MRRPYCSAGSVYAYSRFGSAWDCLHTVFLVDHGRTFGGSVVSARGQYWAANRGRRVPAAGTVRGNKYPTVCAKCGGDLPAGLGVVTFLGGRWVPSHEPVRWYGSPVSGRWLGGCPGDPLAAGDR